MHYTLENSLSEIFVSNRKRSRILLCSAVRDYNLIPPSNTEKNKLNLKS